LKCILHHNEHKWTHDVTWMLLHSLLRKLVSNWYITTSHMFFHSCNKPFFNVST
jgi:hypothetical protein